MLAVLTDPLDRMISPKRSRFAALALALSLLLPAGRAEAQSDEDKAAARVLATQGAEALSGSKYAESLDLVSRAEQMFHAPTHLLLIARSQAGLGRLVAAKETYLKLTREDLAPGAPSAFKRAQQEGKDEMTALEARIASLRIAVDGGGQQKFTVKMDDQPVSPALLGVYRPVDPGKHDVVIYPVGQGPVKGTIELKDGEKKDLKLTIPEAEAYVASLRRAGVRDLGRPLVATHTKYAYPVANLILVLIAVPLAARRRRGGQAAQLGIGLGVAFVYLAVQKVVEPLGYVGTVPPAVAAWAPHGAFLALAGVLLWRARR